MPGLTLEIETASPTDLCRLCERSAERNARTLVAFRRLLIEHHEAVHVPAGEAQNWIVCEACAINRALCHGGLK